MDFPLTRTGLQIGYLGPSVALSVVFLFLGAPSWLAALLCLAVWLIVSFSYSGKEISADYTEIRNYYSLVGCRFGLWQPMPDVVGITVKYFSALDSAMPASMSWGSWQNSTKRLEELVIMLSVRSSRQGIIIGRASVDSRRQIQAAAQHLADALAVPLHTYGPSHF